jgi:hypothetical protein
VAAVGGGAAADAWEEPPRCHGFWGRESAGETVVESRFDGMCFECFLKGWELIRLRFPWWWLREVRFFICLDPEPVEWVR